MKRGAAALAVGVLTAIYLLFGHLSFWPGGRGGKPRGFDLARPSMTGGDEPHYLLIVNSLLADHDVRLDADFARVRAGGHDAGARYRGAQDFGGHTYLVDPRTGRHVLCIAWCTAQDIEALGGMRDDMFQVPAHPIAYPALMALFALPFRPSTPEVEPLVGTFSIAISIAGVLLAYACARGSGLASKHAALAAALLAFASPWLVYLRSYFADPSIGVFLLLAFLALRKRRMVLCGIALGVAMAMKAVFVLFAFVWILDRLVVRRFRDAFVLTASVGVCGVVLLTTNFFTLGTPMAGGALPFSFAKDLTTLWDTLFSAQFGVCVFAPWTIAAFVWGLASLRRSEAIRQMMLPSLAYLAVVVALPFGPGWCWGPRYCVPLLPLFAIVAVDFAISGPRWRRLTVAALAAFGLVVALPSTLHYHTLFQQHPLTGLASMLGVSSEVIARPGSRPSP